MPSTKDIPIGLLALSAGLEVNGAFEKNDLKKELEVVQININATLHLTHHFSETKTPYQGEKGFCAIPK